ncbi:glycine cleavage system T protein [Wallemia mellicola]|uniref:Aminomethyltransferase n=1 Tax=Wallemia mellicola TaxID=1708541 RepID=A0A4T0R9F1_9BASI|nr:glycine cleavage system T protein [Wallemia mellicola]
MKLSGILCNTIKKTPLYDWHIARGAQMVPFAGWSMPLQYKAMGQVDAHNHVRKQAGLFDVSHMQQIIHSYLTQKYSLKQPKSSNFIHSILPVSYNQLTNTGSYSLILTEEGGIVDDCILTKWSDESWYLVTNAARSKEVANWLTNQQERYQDETGESISIDYLESKKQALLALQGPKAAEVLARHSETSLKELYFGNVSQNLRLSGGANVHIARSGYTGEDGFEISVEERDAVAIADMLADGNPTIPIGLGARDSLRLEAGLCLYGNDLWENDLTVGEAGLAWTIAKDRRNEDQVTKFPGWGKVIPSLKLAKMSKRRVGLTVEKGPAARQNASILNTNEEKVGHVTSGAPSPTLNQNIAMGYLPKEFASIGTKVLVDIRGRKRQAEVVKMPFVANNYYREGMGI